MTMMHQFVSPMTWIFSMNGKDRLEWDASFPLSLCVSWVVALYNEWFQNWSLPPASHYHRILQIAHWGEFISIRGILFDYCKLIISYYSRLHEMSKNRQFRILLYQYLRYRVTEYQYLSNSRKYTFIGDITRRRRDCRSKVKYNKY